jgi:hypothetical protein
VIVWQALRPIRLPHRNRDALCDDIRRTRQSFGTGAYRSAWWCKMIAFAQRLAKDKKAALPPGYDKDFDICRRFLAQNVGR